MIDNDRIDTTGTTIAEETPDTAQQPTRADAWSGIVFVIFGLLIAFESWRMPRMEEFGSSIWSAPGVVPGMIGLSLTMMGAFLFLRARQAIGLAPPPRQPGTVRRLLITLLLCFGFAYVAVGLIPFVLAAFLFLFSFIMVFDREDRRAEGKPLSGRALYRRAALAFVISAIAAWGITTVFEDIFFVRLP